MGNFNTVIVPTSEICTRCGEEYNRWVQFHFGAETLALYRVGETLAWGDSDEGEPGHRMVAVQGDSNGCPNCGYNDGSTFEILIENDVIISVKPDSGKIDYLSQGNYYWVVVGE